jgi:hypothetical protein
LDRTAQSADDLAMVLTNRVVAWRPLGLVLLMLWLALGGLLVLSMRHNGGHFVYGLDDPYIHMAMAKSVALHHVWGIDSSGFTSSSSSPVWTAALGLAFTLVGIRDTIPFAFNVAIGSFLLYVVARILARARLSDTWTFVALALVAFATPLPALVFGGQEHILHVLLVIVFVDTAARFVADDVEPGAKPRLAALAGLAALLPVTRYEGLYAVGLVTMLLLLRRHWREAAVVAVAGALPVTIYGAISVAQGWYFLPNSVLVKANRPDFGSLNGALESLGYLAYQSLNRLPAVAFPACAAIALLALAAWRTRWAHARLMLWLFLAMTLAQLQFSQLKSFWLYRYEAYVIALGVVSVAVAGWASLSEVLRARTGPGRTLAGALLALLVVASPLAYRAVVSLAIIPTATANIYDQQYQMGLFLGRYYAGTAVALNDIGAATYLSDARCVDLAGLANLQIARARFASNLSTADYDDITRDAGARIAIVFDHWFSGIGLPPTWVRVATWTIPNARVVSSDTVTFYATSAEEAGALSQHLAEFASDLPRDVVFRRAF